MAGTGNHFWTERVKDICCVGKHTLGGQRGSRSELETLFEFLHVLAGRGVCLRENQNLVVFCVSVWRLRFACPLPVLGTIFGQNELTIYICCVGKHTLGGQRGSRRIYNLFEFLHALAGRGAAGEPPRVKVRI